MRNMNAKSITEDAKTQLSLLCLAILNKLRRYCNSITNSTLRKNIPDFVVLDSVREISGEDLFSRIEPWLCHNITIFETKISYVLEKINRDDEITAMIDSYTGLSFSHNLCKRIFEEGTDGRSLTKTGSVLLASFLEFLCNRIIDAAHGVDEQSDRPIGTETILIGILRKDYLRWFASRNNIIFTGVGTTTYSSSHNPIKRILTYKTSRKFLQTILNSNVDNMANYKFSRDAVNDLFTFVESRVRNHLESVVEAAFLLRGVNLTTPEYIKCICKARGVDLRNPLYEIKANTALTLLKSAGSELTRKQSDDVSLRSVVSSLIQRECDLILRKAISIMKYKNRNVIKTSHIFQAAIESGFIICTYTRSTIS
jgi:hypothetical protein